MTAYRNAELAFQALVNDVLMTGAPIDVRGSSTIEVTAQLIEIERVRERCVIVPGRNNNVFATIAETMWVLSGRNDLAYLSEYLPRAEDFSDDGKTWRAGYGKRLRNWNGVDQLSQIVRILSEDPNSRRAVITLFDPDRDFIETKDVPCNNWLHFLIRDGTLELHVAARSTDLWWGFSGINAFEWSVLLEMMAFWLGVEVGRLTFFTSSLHLYKRHLRRAKTISVQDPHSTYSLESDQASFSTPWEVFDVKLAEWMRAEEQIRNGAELSSIDVTLTDDLLISYLKMVDMYWCHKRGANKDEIKRKILTLDAADLATAATEYFSRS
jgi:thymidylate synthase